MLRRQSRLDEMTNGALAEAKVRPRDLILISMDSGRLHTQKSQ